MMKITTYKYQLILAFILISTMLLIIGGLSYLYITGSPSTTKVILTIENDSIKCSPQNGPIEIIILNDGIEKSSIINVSLMQPSGRQIICNSIDSIAYGEKTNTTCIGRTEGTGSYEIIATYDYGNKNIGHARGNIYCQS